MRQRRLVGSAVLLVILAPFASGGMAYAASPPTCAPPATRSTLAGAFAGSPLTVLNSPLLQVQLLGASGTFRGHVVLEPVPAPPPAVSDGCKEDSTFTVSGFTGTLVASGPAVGPVPVILTATQPIDASLHVHFGSEPSRPLLTFHSDTPVQGSFGTVTFVQIVGGQVVASH
jgi:hypothetical protein